MATPFPFQAAAVLTAAQLNAIGTLVTSTKTASHTLTIADVSTRVIMNSASATTITVNTSIFGASDKVEILNIGAGVCTVTAGTCTVDTSGTLALVQNAGGTLTFISASASVFSASAVAATASGLTLVKTQTIGSAVSSVAVTAAFSATHNAYKIIVDGGVGSATALLGMVLGSTATGYYEAAVRANYSTGTVDSGSQANGSSFARIGNVNSSYINLAVDVINPFAAKVTLVNGMFISLTQGGQFSGYQDSTTSFTAFTLTPASGTLTGGNIKVYGYQA